MTLSLHTIKPAKGAIKKRKRVGRGNASGHGTYSGHGLKGQKARSGGSKGLKRMGMKLMVRNIPKKRGFKSDKPKDQVINISDLNLHFHDEDVISTKILVRMGLIEDANLKVKILGDGELKIKGLKLSGIKTSASALEQIKKMNGEIK